MCSPSLAQAHDREVAEKASKKKAMDEELKRRVSRPARDP
jgi:hypothetical protein